LRLLADGGVPDAAGFDDGFPLPVRKELSGEATLASVTDPAHTESGLQLRRSARFTYQPPDLLGR